MLQSNEPTTDRQSHPEPAIHQQAQRLSLDTSAFSFSTKEDTPERDVAEKSEAHVGLSEKETKLIREALEVLKSEVLGEAYNHIDFQNASLGEFIGKTHSMSMTPEIVIHDVTCGPALYWDGWRGALTRNFASGLIPRAYFLRSDEIVIRAEYGSMGFMAGQVSSHMFRFTRNDSGDLILKQNVMHENYIS